MAIIFSGKFTWNSNIPLDISDKEYDKYLFAWCIDENNNFTLDGIESQSNSDMEDTIQFISRYVVSGELEYIDDESDDVNIYKMVILDGAIRKYKGTIIYNGREVL